MTPNLLAPSASFKKEVAKSIAAIVAFMVVYLALIAASIGLVIGAFYAGIAIITLKPGIYTILAGLGIMGAGVMVFVFMVKFIFSSTKEDNSDSIEITPEDHPKLFAAIDEVVNATGTKYPKKVFLSPDVNACVFYNSSFWSMFFPVRKNLKIGLGLVNSVNASELKAVMAHEFGHFSQRSMKVGSWAYQVNKIIHDMLYNNKGYAESLGAANNIHGIISIFVQITVGIVRFIQSVLKIMFTIVNKSYLGLSRQMEFHADLVSSSVCGSNNMVSALERSEFANNCYQATLHYCDTAWKQKKVIADFYSGHSKVLQKIGEINGFRMVHGLPLVVQKSGSVNRVNFKDQWASHPTLKEREDYLKQFDLTAPVDEESAWSFFNDAEHWKKQLTQHIYSSLPREEVKGEMTTAEFMEMLDAQSARFSFPSLFDEYYDNREIKIFDVEQVANEPFNIVPYEQWFTKEQKALPKKTQMLAQDIAILDAIANKKIDTTSFDFDGKKYRRSKAAEIMAQLESEKAAMEKEIESLDKKLFRYASAVAPFNEADELRKGYTTYFESRKEVEAYLKVATEMMNRLNPIFRGETLQLTDVTFMMNDLKAKFEPCFKEELKKWDERGVFGDVPLIRQKIQKYLAANWVYFFDGGFIETELAELNQIVQEAWECIGNSVFVTFRELAEKQAGLIERERERERERKKEMATIK